MKIVIEDGCLWDYYHWFLLGFYELKNAKKIQLDFEIDFMSSLLKIPNNNFCRIVNKGIKKFKKSSYLLTGKLIMDNGKSSSFCIDCADSPFLFSESALKKYDCYFKMQCPKDLKKKYFRLSDKINIPWQDHEISNGVRKKIDLKKYSSKIYPLLIGTRRLGRGISYRSLKKGYKEFLKGRNTEKNKKLMCYFGNSFGPNPKKTEHTDFNDESNIVGNFEGIINHPNEKRAIVSEYISSLGENYDARVIVDNNNKRTDLIIPLNDFGKHVGNFEYNFNVSGYRLSIPNRFMDSFIVGTSIVTDRLFVKWYLPFDKEEVIETVEMGYLKNDDVNWKKFRNDIIKLSNSKPKKIIDNFEKKWSPINVSQYIVDTLIMSGKQKG